MTPETTCSISIERQAADDGKAVGS